jgi:hypothetical protein
METKFSLAQHQIDSLNRAIIALEQCTIDRDRDEMEAMDSFASIVASISEDLEKRYGKTTSEAFEIGAGIGLSLFCIGRSDQD